MQIELKYHTVMGSEKMMRRPLACRFLGALLREKRRPLWNHRSYISDHCALDRHCNLSSGCVIIWTFGIVFLGWSDASSCLPPSSIVWRLSCSREPIRRFASYFWWQDRLTYVKKFMFKRSFWPCTRLFYDTLCTYSTYSLIFYCLFVFQRMYFVYMHVLPMCWWIKINIL